LLFIVSETQGVCSVDHEAVGRVTERSADIPFCIVSESVYATWKVKTCSNCTNLSWENIQRFINFKLHVTWISYVY